MIDAIPVARPCVAADFEYNFTVMAPRCGVVRRCDIDAAMAGDMVPAGGGEAPDDDDAGAAAAADGGDADGTDREVVGKVQLELPGDRDARVKPPDDAWVQAAGGLWKSLRGASRCHACFAVAAHLTPCCSREAEHTGFASSRAG